MHTRGLPKDSIRYNLEAHQQLIDWSKEQIVRQGWKPGRGKHQVRILNNRVFETLGVRAPRLLGHQRPNLGLHRLQRQTPIYPCRSPYCRQPQLNWIKMRLSGGWSYSTKNMNMCLKRISMSATSPKSCHSWFQACQPPPSCSRAAPGR